MDASTIAIMSMIMGSWITIFGAILWQSYQHKNGIKSVNTNVAALDTRVTALETKVDAMDDKVTVLDGKVDALAGDVADTRERVVRIERHLIAPGSFTTDGLNPAVPDEPRPEDRGSDPDRRQAS